MLRRSLRVTVLRETVVAAGPGLAPRPVRRIVPAMQVHLVDGTYELFRHHFAVPSHLDHDGIEVAAVRGVMGSLLMMLEQGATHVGVATDQVIESFRNDLWAGYKTGAGVPPELMTQFPLLEDALVALGVAVWPMVELEADDAMASAAAVAQADPRVERVLICTPDKDLAQCVEDPLVVQVDRRQDTVIDEAGVRAKFGVGPRSIPDYLALVGDSADGFPGLPGWGAKSTAMVLARYEHLDAIPDDAREWDVEVRGAGEARVDARGRARCGQPVPRPRDAAHERRRGRRRRLAVARARTRARAMGRAARIGESRPPCELGSPNRGGNEMETLDLKVGEYTFSARADGPAERRARAPVARFPGDVVRVAEAASGARGGGVPRRGARPARLRDAALVPRASTPTRSASSRRTRSGSPTRSASTASTSSATTGEARSRGTSPANTADRLRTLTVVSTPHPTPFSNSIAEGEQREKSSYMLTFRDPSAEALFLDNDAAMLRGLYETSGLPDTDAAAEYVRVFLEPGALTGGLNWYRANDFRADIGPITVPTMYVWSTDDIALGREAAEGTGRVRARARTASR